MEGNMKALVAGLIIVAAALMILNYVVRFKIGFTNAKRIYDKQIAKTEVKLEQKMKEIVALNNRIEEERAEFIKTNNAIMVRHKADMEALKTRTAKELRKEKASTETVLAQLGTKEIALERAENTIDELNKLNADIIEAANRAQMKLNAEWQDAMRIQDEKYSKCQDWGEALERELYKKTGFWNTAKKVAGGVIAGYFAAKIIK